MTAEAARLSLSGEVNIYRAAELKETLMSALGKTQALEIDLAGVTELDTAGLQLLILAKRTAQAADKTLRLTGHSPAVLEIFEMLDLGAYFGDAVVMA